MSALKSAFGGGADMAFCGSNVGVWHFSANRAEQCPVSGGEFNRSVQQGVSSNGQCNSSCSLLAGVSKAKVFRGR